MRRASRRVMIALKQILVATDFSEASDAALLYGRQLARAHGATLHLLHIVGNVASEMASPIGIGPNSGQMQMELEADAQRRLDELLAADVRGGLPARAVALSSVSIAQALL